MPLAVYVLGAAIFAQGTSEFMLAGLLPDIASGLDVSISLAGLLVSAFAIGMLVGAPLLAVLTLRLPRRRTLVAFLVVFVIMHAAGAVAPSYEGLFATRVVSAFVYAGFWAVALSTALRLVPAHLRGRGLAIVTGGLTVATVLGVPAGAAISQYAGWRAVFWSVAAISALAAIAIATALPADRRTPGPGTPRLRTELRSMTEPRLWLAYGISALTAGAGVAAFGYLGALLVDVTRIGTGWVPAVLALYGLGALAGITIGGRTADAAPFRTLFVTLSAFVVLSGALALTASEPAAVIPLVFLLGAVGFATNPSLNTRVFSIASEAPTLAAAFHVSAINAGLTAAPWLGGLAIDAHLGLESVAWVGGAMSAVALAGTVLARAVHRPAVAPTVAEPSGDALCGGRQA